jgi:alpha-beta hydrolase superfamily lysophospholipase
MQRLRTPDGLSLHLRHWPLREGIAPRGTVQIVHGLGEHIERYAALAAALNADGWQVTGHDQRGHGLSDGPRGGLAADDALLADLALVTDHLRASVAASGPQVLLGHSMGGLVAARFVAEGLADAPAAWSRDFDALVLSSPALDAGLGIAQKAMLAVASRVRPDQAMHNGLKPEWVSRDRRVVYAYEADILNHDRITPRLVRFIVEGGELVAARAATWRLPTLLMWAGADRCVAPAGSAAFAAAAPPDVVTARAWPGLAHEIFNEPERAEVIAVLRGWLGSTLPAR